MGGAWRLWQLFTLLDKDFEVLVPFLGNFSKRLLLDLIAVMRNMQLVEDTEDGLLRDELHVLLDGFVEALLEVLLVLDLDDIIAGRALRICLGQMIIPAHVAGHALAVSTLGHTHRPQLDSETPKVEVSND